MSRGLGKLWGGVCVCVRVSDARSHSRNTANTIQNASLLPNEHSQSVTMAGSQATAGDIGAQAPPYQRFGFVKLEH